jgi:hypothetical protein
MLSEKQIKLPEPIKESKQLLVEGRSDEEFFKALMRNMGIEGIQIQRYEGKNRLRNFIERFRSQSNFKMVVSLGIVRDADNNAKSAFQSVCSALRNAGLSHPKQPESFEGTKPRIGVLVLPDANTPGMLETICLRSVTDDPAMKCVDEYLNCVQEQLGYLPKTIDKAQVQAFMASRPETVWQLGEAAQKSYWQLNHPTFDHVKRFMNDLLINSTSSIIRM